MKKRLMTPLSPMATFISLIVLQLLMIAAGTAMRANLDGGIADQQGGTILLVTWGAALVIVFIRWQRVALRLHRLNY